MDDQKDHLKSPPFANKSGAAFDKAFAKDMVEDHKKDIAQAESLAK